MNVTKRQGYLLFCAALLLLCSFGIGLLQVDVELTCDRAPASCQLVQSSILHRATTTIPLEALQGAEIQTRRKRGQTSSSYRVMLRTSSDPIPMTQYLAGDLISPYAEKEAIVNQVNEFIQTQKPSLAVRLDDRWFFQIGAATLLISGVMFGVMAWRSDSASPLA